MRRSVHNQNVWVDRVTLQGEWVRLEPLEERHAASMAANGDMDLYEHFVALRPPEVSENGMISFIRALKAQADIVPFAIVLLATGEAIGNTTFMDIRPAHRGLEIGTTWIAKAHQGTKVNPEAKWLMLRHAFENLHAERVQLKCDARNAQSQAAISKLGAKFEGRLRKHFVLPDGFVRDTMMYSIIREEWPEINERLKARLSG